MLPKGEISTYLVTLPVLINQYFTGGPTALTLPATSLSTACRTSTNSRRTFATWVSWTRRVTTTHCAAPRRLSTRRQRRPRCRRNRRQRQCRRKCRSAETSATQGTPYNGIMKWWWTFIYEVFYDKFAFFKAKARWICIYFTFNRKHKLDWIKVFWWQICETKVFTFLLLFAQKN